MKKRRLEEELRRKISRTNDVNEQLDLVSELGALYRSNGELELARDSYKKAAQLASSIGNHLDLSFAHRALGEIYAEEGERKQALEHANLFRQTAQMSDSCSQIQLSLHVSGWIYEKLNMQQSHDPVDLEEALSWCVKSIDYIKKFGHRIDADRKAVRIGGDSARRKAGLDRLCSGLCANLQRRIEAEKYWNAAYSYAKRTNDVELEYQLLLARIDFSWESSVKNAQRLVNFAPVKKKGYAVMELAQVLIYTGDFLGAQNALLECLLHHRSSLMHDDADLLDARVVFLYKYFHRLDRARNSDCPRNERRKMYELIADSFCSYGGDRKEILEHALKYYKLMFQHSVSDKEKCTASISVAQTFMDLEAFDDALEWFEKVLEFERKIGKSDTKLRQTQVLIFEAKCRRKSSTKILLLRDFDELNLQIPETCPSLKASIYRAMGEFFASQGDREEALIYLARAKRLGSESDVEVGSGEEDEENESTSDDLDSRPEKAILRECMELARSRNSDLEIEKDRDKEKNAHGETRLHIAARSNDTAMVDKLIAAGYDVNRRDYGGWTPISEAVSAGMRDNVRALLKAGAKVDPVSTEVLNDEENSTGGGITPLMEACDKGLIEIAKDLLKYGASVTKRNADGWTAVDFLRNVIVSCDEEDDGMYLKELNSLAQFMEDMQRKQSFPVRGCAPQRRKSTRAKPQLKPTRPTSLDEKDSMGLSSYKCVIGKLGGQSTKRNNASPMRDETALFFEDDVTMRDNLELDDDIVLPSDCEGSPVKNKIKTHHRDSSRRSPLCASPLSVNTNSPLKSISSNSRFAPLPIDDDFIVDDEKERRKRKNRDPETDVSRSAKRRLKLNSGAFLSSTQSPYAAFEKSPSPEVVTRRSQRRSQRASISSREASPVSLSLNSNSGPSTIIQGPIICTLKFENDRGEMLRPDKLVTFQRTATMANAEERFRSELPSLHQAESFNLRLGDGREADAEIPLVTLGEPLVIVCCLQRPTAEVLYRSRGGSPRKDVIDCLANFDATGELDLSPFVNVRDRGSVEIVLKAATDSKREIANLILDACDITDGVLSSLATALPHVAKFSCKYTGLLDEQLSTLCATTSALHLSSLDLSHNPLSTGVTLSAFLTTCSHLSELFICDLEIHRGEEELVKAISELQELRMLNVSFNSWLRGHHAENILSSCENLSDLLVDGCDLRGLSFEPTWLPNLRSLSMIGCQLTKFDSLIEWMSMGCVQKLDLSGTEITLDHVRTLIDTRMMCPPIVVRLTRARAVERDPQAFVDMILPFVGDRSFPIRFSFSAYFTNAVRTTTAFASNFLCS